MYQNVLHQNSDENSARLRDPPFNFAIAEDPLETCSVNEGPLNVKFYAVITNRCEKCTANIFTLLPHGPYNGPKMAKSFITTTRTEVKLT